MSVVFLQKETGKNLREKLLNISPVFNQTIEYMIFI